MNQQTQQFMYRAVILTVCAILGGIFVFLFVVAVKMGDGEAVRLTDAMQPLAISVLGTMVTIVLGSHAAGAFIAKQQANVSIAAGSSTLAALPPSPAALVAAIPTVTPTPDAANVPASGV